MQFYLIRRGEQEYQAPSIESLKQWAEQGRLKKTDQIFDIETKTWVNSTEFHALKDFFQSQRLNDFAFDWIVKRKDQLYPVKDLMKLEQWAKDGKLGPLDLLINQKNKEEKRIKDIPQLFSLIPENIQREYLPKQSLHQIDKLMIQQPLSLAQEFQQQNQQLSNVDPQLSQINPLSTEGTLSFDLSLFEPIYDFIRLYMICEPLKLFDVLKKSTYIVALNLDFAGFEKIAIYHEYLIHLQKHLNEHALPYQTKVPKMLNEKYQLWLEQLQKMIFLLDRLSLQYQHQEIELIQAEEALTAYQIKETIYQLVGIMKEIKAMRMHHLL